MGGRHGVASKEANLPTMFSGGGATPWGGESCAAPLAGINYSSCLLTCLHTRVSVNMTSP